MTRLRLTRKLLRLRDIAAFILAMATIFGATFFAEALTSERPVLAAQVN
jgi:hypothetical protein